MKRSTKSGKKLPRRHVAVVLMEELLDQQPTVVSDGLIRGTSALYQSHRRKRNWQDCSGERRERGREGEKRGRGEKWIQAGPSADTPPSLPTHRWDRTLSINEDGRLICPSVHKKEGWKKSRFRKSGWEIYVEQREREVQKECEQAAGKAAARPAVCWREVKVNKRKQQQTF